MNNFKITQCKGEGHGNYIFHGAGRNRYPGGDMQSAGQGNDRISV